MFFKNDNVCRFVISLWLRQNTRRIKTQQSNLVIKQ